MLMYSMNMIAAFNFSIIDVKLQRRLHLGWVRSAQVRSIHLPLAELASGMLFKLSLIKKFSS